MSESRKIIKELLDELQELKCETCSGTTDLEYATEDGDDPKSRILCSSCSLRSKTYAMRRYHVELDDFFEKINLECCECGVTKNIGADMERHEIYCIGCFLTKEGPNYLHEYLRDPIYKELEQELRQELRQDIQQNLYRKFTKKKEDEIKNTMKSQLDQEIYQQVEDKIRSEVVEKVQKETEERLRPLLIRKIKQELKKSIKLSMLQDMDTKLNQYMMQM